MSVNTDGPPMAIWYVAFIAAVVVCVLITTMVADPGDADYLLWALVFVGMFYATFGVYRLLKPGPTKHEPDKKENGKQQLDHKWEEEQSLIRCPICGSELVERKSPSSNKHFTCPKGGGLYVVWCKKWGTYPHSRNMETHERN